MNIVVIGAGALGAYFGTRLISAGHRVQFLVRDRRAAQIKEQGLNIHSVYGDERLEHPDIVSRTEEVEACDLVILAVKGYHLEAVLPTVRALTEKGAFVLPLLNGITHVQHLGQIVGEDKVLGGLAYIIATLDEKGHVHHTSEQHDIIFGPLHPKQKPICRELEETASKVNFRLLFKEDITFEMWKKYVFITTFSGVTTAARVSIGPIRNTPQLEKLAQTILTEMTALAAYYCSDEAVRDIKAQAGQQLQTFPDEATSSMHQDLRKGQPLESDHLLGGAVTLGQSHGLDLPHVETLHALLTPFKDGCSIQ
ncbi:ketopantoate reductase family protein [Tuberibacillus sp. Marseille-P3662]|uniref:ketopantoate reductase family protein n=1 Tax=Tuberibacillus sp. Marseille-P3662 TaxID=1965358 RepID=UPI000A1C861E|nr:2-dehydropantoate 2-reductase [Tuberibacillus sp. Marseille-P3662]